MNKMHWNQNTMSYQGECSDGAIVDVSGDEWSESVAEGVKSEADHRGIDWETITDEQREELTTITENELDDPDWWASLAGDNQNVTIIGE